MLFWGIAIVFKRGADSKGLADLIICAFAIADAAFQRFPRSRRVENKATSL
jgi:hypothetical protein